MHNKPAAQTTRGLVMEAAERERRRERENRARWDKFSTCVTQTIIESFINNN